LALHMLTKRWTGIAVLVLFAGFALMGCAGSGKMSKTSVMNVPVTVTAKVENLRDAAGGDKVGEVKAGTQLTQTLRRGNWSQVRGAGFGEAWVWAPSLGFDLVSPADVRIWLGPANTPVSIDDVVDVFGPQTTVEMLSGSAVEYIWNNILPGGNTLFGTSNVNSVRVAVDRTTKKVFAVTIELPPFNGKTKEALSYIGLSETKSTSINGDRAQYDGKFPGVDRVELWFKNGDFLKIGTVKAWRYDPGLWQRNVNVSEQKAIQEGKSALSWQMTLTNLDRSHAYASPTAEVEIVYHGKSLGKWTLSANVRVGPGQVNMVKFPIPIDITGKDVKEIAGRADIQDMLVLPAN